MAARDTLTAELRAEVKRLENDLRTRVTTLPPVQQAWQAEYNAARAVERTSAAWEEWVDERVTLAAVAWVLTTVFIRFCEDNALVKPVWISGPRSREAVEAQRRFLHETARVNPDVTDREWLAHAVEYLRSLPATAGLVDATSPMWLVSPSGDASTRLLNYWRERDEDGKLRRDLTDPELDTRFLGDLYQDISEDAKKRYALLQTPVFVEEFIIDRTLEPALDERPLEGFKMIDPTCGSGHFLLGGFRRLLNRWHNHAPAMDERERVQAALDSIYGVDINPFAMSIARFRLTVAALRAAGLTSLEGTPAFKYHLAVGDSLLHGLLQPELNLGARYSTDKVAGNFTYATENLDLLRSILRNDQFDVVVGNPPYIQVKDRALSAAYRARYSTCAGKYSLTVPFMERFFMLGKSGPLPGWVGLITSNSFMKREFGAPLIEQFLPTKDLRYILDVEGAWIPGHNMDGTPTSIIIGTASRPTRASVRVVLSKSLRETPNHVDGTGPYWSGMIRHLDDVGFESDYISIVDERRTELAKHPWSLTGGGVVELSRLLDAASGQVLGTLTASIGITSFTLEDDVFVADRASFRTREISPEVLRQMVLGDGLRDFTSIWQPFTIFPYDDDYQPVFVERVPQLHAWMWPYRTNLSNSKMFGGETKVEAGLRWSEFGRLTASKLKTPLSIALAFVATHNHFVLDRGGKVFNRSAPIIKLVEGASEEQHLALVGVLNSSLTCFWMRQRSQPKGGAAEHPWSRTYEFTGTTMRDFPLPSTLPSVRGTMLDSLGQTLVVAGPETLKTWDTPTRASLDEMRTKYNETRSRMIAEQEELDWEEYRQYGLIEEDLTYSSHEPPQCIDLGERAFEIVLARRVATGEEETAWFERHGSTPITEMPAHWSRHYRDLVESRIALIESHPYIRLVERPEYKRRWATEPWEKQEERALRNWLLDHLEDRKFWFDLQGRPTPKSIAVLADEVARDADIVSVLALREGRPDVPVATSLQRLTTPEAVPFLAAYRYNEAGLRKRAAWEETWRLQRLEDAKQYNPAPINFGGDGPIPVPPKYTNADFLRSEYWANRGKLDVPKERFILYPNAGREGDPSPVVGWAGWDHAQQSLALATLLQLGEEQDWDEETRLKPLVAGLDELLPWVEQWHHDPEPLYGGSPAEFFNGILETHMAKLGVTRESLRAWRPPAPARGRRART
ncbi:MAG: BREX-2 system adenine-specific DNA-methyltransferase PglX [Chloroflexi bacterium]|nr:BREX-2 system adenine-specific DNA-methyltransferase PglX [Chloroflexota bacterium]